MAAKSETFAEKTRRALRDLERWERAATRAEAELIGQEHPDSSRVELWDRLGAAIVEARLAWRRFDGASGDGPAIRAVTSAWDRVQELLPKRSESIEPSEDQIKALEALIAALEAATIEPSAEADVFASGALPFGQLRRELAKVLADIDWQEAEQALGTPIPESVRQRPVEITPFEDRADGAAPLHIRYAPWASEAVRAGVRRLFDAQLLPDIRAAKGQGAIGDRKAEPPAPDAHVCQVLFGTNRERKNGAFGIACAEGEDSLTLGKAILSVPNRRKRGSIPRPWRVLNFGPRPEAGKHILLAEAPTLLSHDAFVAEVKASTGPGSAFLFIHGFNTSFEGGLRRTAQLATDLDVEGLVFHYAWPSAANPLRYDFDADNLRASRTPFKAFIKTLLTDAGVTALNVVAHSKGNELVLEAFHDLAVEAEGQRRAQHLVLASPDVARSVAKDLLTTAPSFFSSVTLYANAYDRPLLLSSGKASRARIGGMMSDHHPFIAEGVDTIDAANTDFEWFGFNHDAYVDAPVLMYDLAALLKKGVRPPDERSPVIRPRDCRRGRYYKVETT